MIVKIHYKIKTWCVAAAHHLFAFFFNKLACKKFSYRLGITGVSTYKVEVNEYESAPVQTLD